MRAALLLLAAAAGCAPSAKVTSVTQSEVMTVAAWVTASFSNAIATVAVATGPDGARRETPYVDRGKPQSGEVTLALLGLPPDLDYDVQLEAYGAPGSGGGVSASAPVTFHSGPLPDGLPAFTAQGGPARPQDFMAMVGAVNPSGAAHAAMVVDAAGRVVWYHATEAAVMDFQRHPDGTYTAAELTSPPRFDQFDREGRLLRIWVPPAESSGADPHELRLLAGGDALLLGTLTRTADFSAVGGSASAQAVGQVLYRLGPAGEVSFRWSPFDHLAFADVDPAVDVSGSTVDWTHADAIDVAADGNYLVTFRNLSQVVKIDSASGAVLWRLGGKRSSFTFPDDPLGGPSFPHGARELADGHVLLFDGGNGRASPSSRAVEYALDAGAMQARVAWTYAPSPPAFAGDFGFAQRLQTGDPGTDGNTLVTFGSLGRVDEVTPAGQVVWSLQSPGASLYRARWLGSLY